jgi:flagellar biosynthesis protein FliR
MPFTSIEFILAVFLIFVRVGAVVMTAPFFSASIFPVRVKLFFALFLSIMLFPIVPASTPVLQPDSGGVFVLTAILIEVLTGVAIGLSGQIVFAGLHLAGQLISIQIVLGFAQVVDNTSQTQSGIVTSILNTLAILVFLSMGGDKVFINAIARSFEVIPLTMASVEMVGPFFLNMATYMFMIGVQITTPFMIVLFLLDLSFAIFARIMPQANIFFIAMPIKVGVGLIILNLLMPYLPLAFDTMFIRLFDYIAELLGVLAG